MSDFDRANAETPAQRLAERWRRGLPTDVGDFLRSGGRVSPTELVDVLRVDQEQRWAAGERVLAEAYLERFQDLRGEEEAALELIYAEFVLREGRGERPRLEEYAQRFPEHAARLRLQFELASAMRDSGGRSSIVTIGESQDADSEVPRVPGYVVLAELGRGGMGVVYKARHVELHRLVALKMLHGAAPEEEARFRHEGEALARGTARRPTGTGRRPDRLRRRQPPGRTPLELERR